MSVSVDFSEKKATVSRKIELRAYIRPGSPNEPKAKLGRCAMNRKQRHMAKRREQSVQVGLRDIYSRFDIQVEGKFERVVMICANPKGRRIVEDLWPDVQWTNDEVFSRAHAAQWLFTHVRVTRLPPHLEETTPLAFATPDSLAFAVACALYRRAWPVRVAYYTGQGDDLQVNMFGLPPNEPKGADLALYADYVPPGGYAPPGVQRGTAS